MISVQRRVEFRDTDAAGIMHFSAFFPMMESAEHEVLRLLGISVMQALVGGSHLTWPRVSAKCDYLHAVRFEQLLDIDVSTLRVGTTSVTYGFRFRHHETLVAMGEIVAVCCVWTMGHPLEKIKIPDDLRERLSSLHA